MVATGTQVVVTHGNGPQVGFLMRRSEIAQTELPLIPLDILVADTQGGIGYMIQQCLVNELKKRGLSNEVVSVVTQVEVDAADRAFSHPAKPIGGFMTEVIAQHHAKNEGWTVFEDAGRGWRRAVASPEPINILEIGVIRSLIEQGTVVICCGGGGIPVVNIEGSIQGVAAVIDKDKVSALLARELKADMLVVTTGVEKVAINFGTPEQKVIDTMTVAEAEAYYNEGHFPPGSMGPKIEAALDYLRSTEGVAIITTPEKMAEAISGHTGTHIVQSK